MSNLPVPVKQKPFVLERMRTIIRDGWMNVITGLGIRERNKLANTEVDYDFMTEYDAQTLYAANDIAAKIVDDLPEEALREGFSVEIEGDTNDKKLQRAMLAENERLDVRGRFLEAWKWSRAFGGAAIVPMFAGSDDPSEPLPASGPLRPIENFLVVNRHELVFDEVQFSLLKQNFGLPETYQLVPRGANGDATGLLTVHHTRVIRFDGALLPRDLFIRNGYWGDSFLNRAQNAIRNLDASLEGIATALQDFSVAKYKVKGLARMIAGGDDEAVIKRMQIMDLCRSVSRAVAIDADGEDFDYQQRNFGSVAEILHVLQARVVAAADHIPHTELLGEGPEGFGKNGESEKRDWFDFVRAQQKNYAERKIRRIQDLLFRQRTSPTNGQVPKSYTLKWLPLWQETAKDRAETQKTQAEADGAYVNMGVLDPSEVRKARFGGDEFSQDMKIDSALDAELEARAAAAAAAGEGTGEGAETPSPAAE